MKKWIDIAWYTSDIYDFPNEISDFLSKYSEYDLVIPVFHGIYGEDGQVTAFLATLGCKYAYSDFETHTLCIDKNLTNLALWDIDIKIPESIFIKQRSTLSIDLTNTTFPLIVKPNRWGSSLNTTKVSSEIELNKAIWAITDDDILIQKCIGWKEYTVGVYEDNLGTHVLPVIEIVTIKQDFFDYEEKYESDGSNEVFSDIESSLRNTLETISTQIYDYLKCRGVVRMDYRYDGMEIYFLEVNTIPGFTSGSLVPKMWKKARKTEKEFIDMLNI